MSEGSKRSSASRTAVCSAALAAALAASGAWAEDTEPGMPPAPDLVKQANAPISGILQFRLQNTYQPEFEQVEGDGNVFTVSVTMPLPRYRLLPLPQLSLLTIPAAVTPPRGETGFGDLRFTDIVVLHVNHELLWGIGPVLVFPTATERTAGQEKWQIGPALALAYAPKGWLFGLLAQNPISIAGDGDRPDANALVLQPVVTYQLGNGWFVRSQPQMLFNWKTNDEIVPVNLGVGRIFRIGRQTMNLFVEPSWTAVTDEPAPRYGITLGLSLLYPNFWGS